MSAARHTPEGDASFRASLVRNGAGAVGLVVLVSLVFWGIGSIGGETGTPIATDEPETGTDAGDDTVADEEPDPDPDPPAEPEPDDGDAEDDDGEPADAEEPADADEADDADDADDAATERAVTPGDVTVQVLDGFKEDGGTAADQVAARLGDAGYQVIARNDALTYEVTTVLYNPGNEAAARQVAAELGGAEVREQPGNLSSAVALHVVVGRDRG